VSALDVGLITPDIAEYVLKGTDTARLLLDEALKLNQADLTTAQNKLNQALSTIESLKSYLEQNGVTI
jgi:hypothetical protein